MTQAFAHCPPLTVTFLVATPALSARLGRRQLKLETLSNDEPQAIEQMLRAHVASGILLSFASATPRCRCGCDRTGRARATRSGCGRTARTSASHRSEIAFAPPCGSGA